MYIGELEGAGHVSSSWMGQILTTIVGFKASR